ncbi:MAG: site-specific DNA-methyltransferase [Desulfobacterales bacterium]|nr:site-specific DNA-methyltransferase [Desulfobacterales bacterium]
MGKETPISFQTSHRAHFGDAGKMTTIADNSVNLVVTSPPYPMIAMWDEMFGRADPEIKKALKQGDGPLAFERMHGVLVRVWRKLWRVVKPGGFACINIGDAVRTVNGDFRLYPNHARILADLLALGFSALPAILWRKQTNAPNKFMGSGMLPAGAYVTLEHEYVLIVRKGSKREFKTEAEKLHRHESAIFWEERNQWFSDIWMDLKGARQALGGKEARKRSAAFPFELACRLINMYSVKGDTVLDPFLGTGTTMAAAMATGRNSLGIEIDPSLAPAIEELTGPMVTLSNRRIAERLDHHRRFIRERMESGKPIKHTNRHYGFPVITRQETGLILNPLVEIKKKGNRTVEVVYADGSGPIETEWGQKAGAETPKPAGATSGQLMLNL